MRKKIILFAFLTVIAVMIGGSFFHLKKGNSPLSATKVEIVRFVIDPDKPMVAITYDDGPHESVTPEILDVLEQYNAHATFFVIGDRVSHHAKIIQRMVEMGCELGNHTYGHQDLSRLSTNEMQDQLQSSKEALASVVESGYLPKIVRPPFGNTNDQLEKNCPYPLINWSIDTRDWSHQNAQRSIEEVMSQVQDGDIILMHDMYEATAEATKEIVRQLTEAGYQLVTVSEMFEAKGIPLVAGQVYHHAR